ncbi:hypothetical protein [Halolactibacillus sp. JCM 19043]|uniref:hypothetical protein n=1 Tax=Halolactibacillus sp. JCM 19043 TaxID=1460638 RepID=UPI0007824EB0|nr:hypothetical protein [Halolactibacillus sp. JCM 19043]
MPLGQINGENKMKAYFLFGSSLLISVLYISIYTLLSPLTDLFFSLSLLFLVAFFTLNVDRKKSLYKIRVFGINGQYHGFAHLVSFS